MLNPERLVGMPVVAVAEAEKIGYVNELLFAIDPLAVRALRVHGEGGDVLVPFESIGSIGPDAITVGDHTAASTDGTGDEEILTRAALHSLKIVDEAGAFLGTVKGVELEGTSGRIQRLTVEQGGVLGVGAQVRTFDAAAIRHVGREIVTVAEGAVR